MNFLIILSLFLASQVVLANGLSSTTKYYLRSGKIFKIPRYKEARVESFKEINSSPTLLEEARNLVETEHGAERLLYLEHIMKAQEVADILDTELDINVLIVAQMLNHQTMGTELATKEDLEKVGDEVTKEQASRVFHAIHDHR